MKKKYQTPKLTVVSFVVENGFDSPFSASISYEALNNPSEPMEQRSLISGGWAGNDWNE